MPQATPALKKQGDSVVIYDKAIILAPERLTVGSRVVIDDFVFLGRCEIVLGDNIHVAAFSSVLGGGTFIMDHFSGLSAGARIFTSNDDYLGPYLTNPTVPAEFHNLRIAPVRIGRHAIVGTNSVVLPGVSIGEGAVIGANSLVSKDIEPWTVNVGNPTRVIKYRDKEGVKAQEARYQQSLKS